MPLIPEFPHMTGSHENAAKCVALTNITKWMIRLPEYEFLFLITQFTRINNPKLRFIKGNPSYRFFWIRSFCPGNIVFFPERDGFSCVNSATLKSYLRLIL